VRFSVGVLLLKTKVEMSDVIEFAAEYNKNAPSSHISLHSDTTGFEAYVQLKRSNTRLAILRDDCGVHELFELLEGDHITT
jgi:hypothetical protein